MDLRHLARNVLRALPCKFLSSACLEHSRGGTARGLVRGLGQGGAAGNEEAGEENANKHGAHNGFLSRTGPAANENARQRLGFIPDPNKSRAPKAAPAASRALEPRPL